MPVFRILLFFFLCLNLLTTPAHAGNSLLGVKFADPEDIAFAYYKMLNMPLNIDDLIIKDPAYAKLSPVDQRETFIKLRPALADRYAKFSPLTTPLNVRIEVKLSPISKPPALQVTYKSGGLPYFPYMIMGRAITLYPENLSAYTILPLSDDLELRRASYLAESKTTLMLELIPSIASDKPIRMNGIDQYPILCKIARIRFVTDDGSVIWAFANPQYDHLYNTELRGLFAGSKENAPALTAVPSQ